MKKASISKIFVRQDKHLVGIVTAADAADAAKRGDKTLENILIKDIHRVSPDAPAADLFPLLANSKYPIAVVNESDNLQGVIIKGLLMAALAEGTQVNGKENGKAA